MTIKRIRLTNFRQFYGDQKIDFSVTGTRNVTLVHAENGFGKTSILNAVLWALYKQNTPKFERPDDIVNYIALGEGEKKAFVEVEFEFKGQTYLVRRTHFEERDARDKTELEAYKITKGNHQILNAAETFVGTVIPPEMAKYFFFDGEAAESFSSAKNSRELQNAIRTILGCSLAETAIADLRELCKTVEREIGSESGDREIAELEKRLESKGNELDVAAKARDETIANINTWRATCDEIVSRLRDMKGAEEIQRLRDEKARRKNDLENEIAECEVEILKWIGQRAVQVVSRRLSKSTLDFIDEASLRGRIPSPYNEDFVKGLLKAELCVCERPLCAGTKEWASVSNLLKTASNAEVLDRVVRARARTQSLREEATQAPTILSGLQRKQGRAVIERGKLEQEIEELSKKIENLPIKEIADRERSRRHLEEKIDKEREKLGGLKGHIVHLEREKKALGEQLEELARKNKKTTKLLIKRQLLMQSERVLRGLLEIYEKDARKEIQDEINRILEIVAHRDYRCRFSDQFVLELILNDRATPKSGGENQLLSLAFIASLVKFSKTRIDADDLLLRPGTMAPLVLDAPLGQLDPMYQESVAEFLPKLAHQVVLLVSGSQGGERVLKCLEPYVAAEYVLVQHNEGTRGKKNIMQRVLHGKERDLIVYGAKRTMTQIEPI
jgi:DNA sulfur modification protein DndD